ncbi:MAG: c-type cytochrome [Myxococcales bacterium]|nr:c-type cytochrome [Myxococcales bacterium]
MNRRSAIVLAALTAPCAIAACSDGPETVVLVPLMPPTGRAPSGSPSGSATAGIPHPDFGPTVRAELPPPPISGGTLAVLRNGHIVAADPDRDAVYVVDAARKEVTTVHLAPGDEPGRVIQDPRGLVHVVLRGAGAIATLDEGGVVRKRWEVCPAPRGLTMLPDGTHGLVVCEGGEVVRFATDPSAAALPETVAKLSGGLRDVVIAAGKVLVSRLRQVEIVELGPKFEVVQTAVPSGANTMQAMRMVVDPKGQDPFVVHEIARLAASRSGSTPYGGSAPPAPSDTGCDDRIMGGSIVQPALSRLSHSGEVRPGQPARQLLTQRGPNLAAFPVDVAVEETSIAIVAAGNGHTKSLPQVYVFDRTEGPSMTCLPGARGFTIEGQATAVAFRGPGAMVVQSREPAQLELLPERVVIPLSSISREDTGHAIFHAGTRSGIACASCHAEGGDDGLIWTLDASGPVRTTSLRGTLKDTAPFHWRGDVPTVSVLADRVMTGRMSGPKLDQEAKDALEAWMFAIPGPRTAAPTEASARGKALFERADVACATCHTGPRLSKPGFFQGVGGMFQVPSLVGVSTHPPYFHTGCATSLKELRCGVGAHETSHLTADERADLASYLETL